MANVMYGLRLFVFCLFVFGMSFDVQVFKVRVFASDFELLIEVYKY